MAIEPSRQPAKARVRLVPASGGAMWVRIPDDIAAALGLNEGDPVNVAVTDGRVVVEPCNGR